MAKRPASPPRAAKTPHFDQKPPLSRPMVHAVFAGLAVLLVLIYYGSLILKSSPPQAPDTVASDAISKMSVLWRDQHNGEMPLWTPAVFSGMPSYGAMIYTHENPISFVLGKATFGNFGIAMALYTLIGGACVYVLLTRYGRSPLASFFAAAVYMFTPYIPGLINAGHNNKILAAAIIPALLLVTDGLLRERSLKAFGWFVLVAAWQLWVRHPQVTYYGIMLVACIVLADVFVQQGALLARARRLAEDAVLLGAGLVFALGIVADPYLPMLEFTPESVRGGAPSAASELAVEAGQASDRGWEFATQWSMHPKELVSFVVPSFYGLWNDPRYNPQTDIEAHTYWGYMPFTQSTHYLGLIPLILALLVRPNRTALVWGCLVFSGMALLIGLGHWFPVLYWPAYKLLPYFAKFRVPSMIYMLLPLSIGIVGAWALDQFMERETVAGRVRSARRFAREEKIALAVSVAMVVLALAVMVVHRSPGWMLKAGEENYPAQIQEALAQVRSGLLARDVLIALVLAALTAGGLILVSGRRMSGTIFAAILTVATIADLWRLDFTFLDIRRPTFAEAPIQQPAEVGIIRNDLQAPIPDSVRLWHHIATGDTLFRIAPVAGLDQAGAMNIESTNEYGLWSLPSVSGYHAAKLRIYDDLTISGGLSRRQVLNMLNARYVIAPPGLPDSTLVPVGGGERTVYRNTTVLPRAWWVRSVRAVNDRKAALSSVLAPDFDPAEEAIVLGPAPQILPDSTLAPPRVSLWDFHRIEIETNNSRPAFLVLSEIFYPRGWRATADGKPVEIVQTNFVLRGLEVPAGTKKIELTFDSAAYRWGRRLSFTLFPLFLLLVAEETWRAGRKKKGNPTG
ncbi:MAG TPA: hypothetical protein PLV10_01625 [Candidatus Latescibacteria bacterium]|nr:hypothetical protein [Candidatus Latescibacterota bacterium]